MWISEPPSGTIDGINREFRLSSVPIVGSLSLLLNGLELREQVDFGLDVAVITIVSELTPVGGPTPCTVWARYLIP